MDNIAGFIAPAATMIAAIMTAGNLGARATGWGFVLFTLGSLAWCTVALVSEQQSLLLTNGFLVVVNAIGVWRWLGHVAVEEDGARAAESKSEDAQAPTLVAVSNLVGRKVVDPAGENVGKIVGIMSESERGVIAFAVVGVGGIAGIGERLVVIEWANLSIADDHFETSLERRAIDTLPSIDPRDWPIAAT
jgi:sporulation protein YlmC with PRC-barrel domain